MSRTLGVALLVLLPALAYADVVDRSPAGFTVKTVVTIAASPERAFRVLDRRHRPLVGLGPHGVG